jgi:hypothetical protein
VQRVSRNLREKLDDQLGSEATDELLNLMPPDWTQLATTHDLEVLGTELRGEISGLSGKMDGLSGKMDGLRSEVRGEIAAVRGEFSALRSEVRGEFAAVRGEINVLKTELQGEINVLNTELRGEFRSEFTAVRGDLVAQRGEFLVTLHREMRRQTAFISASLLTLAALVLGSQLLN